MANKGFDMELFFAALADRTRLRLVNLMALDEICVCFFVETLGEGQPKVSRTSPTCAGRGWSRRAVTGSGCTTGWRS